MGKRMTNDVNLEDGPMGASTDEVLNTLISRMPPPVLLPTSRAAKGTPASPRLTTPALSTNTSQASSIQGDHSPVSASPVSSWSRAFYLPGGKIGQLGGEQISKDYPLLMGSDTHTKEAVDADNFAGSGVFVIQVMNLSKTLHGDGGLKKGDCRAKIAEGNDTVLDEPEAMGAARVLHRLRS